MDIKTALPLFLGVWGFYIALNALSSKKMKAISENILDSWTLSALKFTMTISEIEYATFSFSEYRDAPLRFKVNRIFYAAYRWMIVIPLTFLQIFFSGLVFVSVVAIWKASSLDPRLIPQDYTGWLIRGHVILILLYFLISAFLTPFGWRYGEKYYEYDRDGHEITRKRHGGGAGPEPRPRPQESGSP